MPASAAIESIYPLSPMQQGLLFHARYQPADDVYVEQVACDLVGDLDTAALVAAWADLSCRHAVLRTSFHARDRAEPVQVVHHDARAPWIHVDLTCLDPATQQRAWQDIVAADRLLGFDTSRPPLQRFALAYLGPHTRRFLWTHHHLLLDGWSVSIVLAEFGECYEARRRGVAPRLAETRPYRDYITWLGTHNPADAKDFWHRYWRDFAAGTRLPMAHETPPETPNAQHVAEALLPSDVTERLTACARQNGVTLGTVIHAGWAVTLARHTGDDDVVFGSTVSGRPSQLTGVERMVGLLINTVPVRIVIPRDMTMATWLPRVQASLSELRQYEHTPLVQAQAYSGVPAGEPLFGSIVAVENFPLQPPSPELLGGLAIRPLAMGERTSYPLTLAAAPGRSLGLSVLVDARVISAATAQLLVSTLRHVLEAIADEPDVHVGDLLRGDAPRPPIAHDDTAVAGTRPDIARLFDEQALAAPDAVAVVDGEHHVTYAALRQQAHRIAAALADAGTRPGDAVGIYLHRGRHLVAALVAIVDLGAAYVPLDPDYPADRLRYMITDSGIATIYTSARLAPAAATAAAETPTRQVLVEDIGPSQWSTLRDNGPDTTAYVIYTSGSTGRPKGIAITHRAVVQLVRDSDYVALEASDRIALASSVTFDAATFEIWGALLNGATVVTIDRHTALTAVEYATVIAAQAVTTAFVTTALFNQIAAIAPAAFAPLRRLLTGGEAIDPDAVRAVFRSGRPQRLVHVYGPTESTTFATWHDIEDLPPGAQTAPIGQAVRNTTAVVLDADLQPVAPGALGELYLGGGRLAHGYVGQPALTAERFVPDPFAGSPGSRMYRTGDLVRSDSAGDLTFIGRADGQIKLRGFRIELGEIESELRRDSQVVEAAVILREDRANDKRIVAYVVTSDGADPADRLRRACAARLPDFMVPSAFVVLGRLPLTNNGKVDRRALPAPPSESAAAVPRAAAPRHGLEEVLAAAWRQVLGVEAVRRHDNFFALGGHSLLAAQLQARLRVSLGIDLPVRTIFEAATLRDLAEAIADRMSTEPASIVAVPALAPGVHPPTYPLSPAQQRLWFLEQWDPGTALYHITGALELDGEFDVAGFVRAWHRLVSRHDTLRTHMSVGPVEPLQTVEPTITNAPLIIDLTCLDAPRRNAVLDGLVGATTDTPFDLVRGPLWRVSVIRTTPTDHVLAIALHHLIADGQSVDIILRDLANGSPDHALAAQYGDYVQWQRSWMLTDRPGRELSYWRGHLAGVGDPLPADHPRPAQPDHRAAQRIVELPAETSTRVSGFARRTGLTTFMTTLSAFCIALGDSRGVDEVVIGTPIANRPDERLDDLIGFFVNTLALRVNLSRDSTFTQFTAHVREVCLGAYAHPFLPFEKVVQEIRPDRTRDHGALFHAWFVAQETPPVTQAFRRLAISPYPRPAPLARYDLRMDYQQSATGPQAVIEYRTELFEPATIARLGRRFAAVLEVALEQPGLTLADIRRQIAVADDDARDERRATVSLASLQLLRSARRNSRPSPPHRGEST